MSPINPGAVVLLNGDGDLSMDADMRPHIGGVFDVEKIAKSGLVVLKVPGGTISVPRRNLTILKISSFGSVGGGKPIDDEPVQVYEDNWPHG